MSPSSPKPQAYARAIYEAALEESLSVLRALSKTLQEDGLATRLDRPGMSFEEKKKALDELLPEDVDHQVRNFVYTLASRNDLSLMDDVLDDYQRLLRAGAIQVRLATVTSAIGLSEQDRQEITRRVQARFGQDVDVRFEVDPEILGGLVVRVDDQVLDGSVQGRLGALRQRLNQAL